MDRVFKINQAYLLTPWRKQLQLIGLFLVVLVVFALIAGVYLNVNARAATTGRQIQNHHNRIETLEQAIADQQSQLALITSASEMEKRALDLGFRQTSSDEILFLVVDEYTGRRPVVLASESTAYLTATAPTLSPAFSQSLLDWVAEELSLPPLEFGWLVP